MSELTNQDWKNKFESLKEELECAQGHRTNANGNQQQKRCNRTSARCKWWVVLENRSLQRKSAGI